MAQHIEDKLRPETVNEVLLINRIRELQRELYLGGRSIDMGFLYGEPITVSAIQPTITLPIAAQASAVESINPQGLRIEARSFTGSRSTQIANYVTEEQLAQVGPLQTARWLDELHRNVTHQLAKFLENSWKEPA